jgi:hypothetical protein
VGVDDNARLKAELQTRLKKEFSDEATLAAWREVVESQIEPQDEDSDFDY